VAERVMRFAQGVSRRLEAGEKPAGDPPRYTARQRTADGRHCQIDATPIEAPGGGPADRMVAVVTDRTAQVRLQQRFGAIEEAGRRLLHLEPETVSRMAPDERLAMLQRQIVDLTTNLLRFDHFRVRLRDPGTDRLELVLTEGRQATDDVRELHVETDGSGITGYVAATGQPYICNDVRADPRYLPWLAEGRSSLTVPLWHRDKVIGTFNVESTEAGAFGQSDLQALEIFSHYVAQALVTLQLLVAEKVSTTDELAGDVAAELNEPLAGILAAAEAVKASYVGHDDETLRRLDEVARHVARIRQLIRQVADAKRPARGARPAAGQGAQPLAGRRVLVADDEPNIRQTLSEILAALGATVDLARDGREAARMGTETAYDLVLADIRMPHKDGYELFSALQEVRPETPVVLMTAFGYDPGHSIVRARSEGLAAVLFKPFKIQLLYDAISEALGIRMELSP
jgi:CheY-like chemotaxis protein